MLAYIMNGGSDASSSFAASATFSDVANGYWAANSIGYCYTKDLVAGAGSNMFYPNNDVTGVQIAKMALVALGYDPTIEKLTGSSWAINTINLAEDAGLFDGMNKDFNASAAASRQEAAQILYNMLLSEMVCYTDNGTNIIVGDITINTDATRKYMNKDGEGVDKKADAELGVEEYFDLAGTGAVQDGTDDYGRPSRVIDVKGVDSITLPDDADLTYEGQVTAGTLYSNLGNDVRDYDQIVYVDGDNVYDESGKETTGDADQAMVIKKNDDTKNGFKGATMEVYIDKDAETVTFVIINTYLAQVDSVDENKDDENLIDIDFDVFDLGTITLDEQESFGYEEDDYLLVTVGKDGSDQVVDVIGAPETIEGTASRISSDYYTIDGTKYNFAGTPAGVSTSFDFDKSYSVYTTADGYVIAIDGSGSVNLEDIYYVTSVYMVTEAGENVYYAQRVSMDGKTDTVKVEKGALEIIAGNTNLSSKIGDPAVITVSGGATNAGLYTFSDKKVAATAVTGGSSEEQKSGNGVYTIKPFTNAAGDTSEFWANAQLTSAAPTLGTKLDADDTKMTLSDSAKFYMNEKTSYLAVESEGSKISVTPLVGGMKITTTTAKTIVITDKDDTKTALAVIFVGTSLSVSSSTKDVVYLAETPTTRVDADNYSTTLYFMDGNTSQEVTIDNNDSQGFYTYGLDNGVYKLDSDANNLTATALTYDDETGYADNMTITSIYSKGDISYISGTATGTATLTVNDARLTGVQIIDNRSSSAIASSVYPTEITTVADLKDAVKAGTVVADVYFDNGVTFIAVDSVDGFTLTLDSTMTSGVNGVTAAVTNPVSLTGIAGGTEITVTLTGTTPTANKTMEIHAGSASGTLLGSKPVTASTDVATTGNTITFTMPSANTTLYLVQNPA